MFPRYKCHKEVGALKIKDIMHGILASSLVFENKDYSPMSVSKDWLDKHKAEIGGYFVVYDDGYKSYSPAKAFEEGYTLIDHNAESSGAVSATTTQITPVPDNPWECSDKSKLPYWQGVFSGETLRADLIEYVTSSVDETVCHLECGVNVTIHHSDRRHPFGEVLPSSLVGGYLVVSHLWLQWFTRDMFLAAYKKV